MMEFTFAQVEFSLSYERIGIHSCLVYFTSQSILPVKGLLYRAYALLTEHNGIEIL